MYSRRSIWLGLVGLILLLFVIGWIIYAILNNSSDSGKEADTKSQSNSQSADSNKNNGSSQSGNTSTESDQKSSQQDSNGESANQSEASDSDGENNSASTNQELADTGSGEVFAVAMAVAIGSAVLHRLYVSRVRRV